MPDAEFVWEELLVPDPELLVPEPVSDPSDEDCCDEEDGDINK